MRRLIPILCLTLAMLLGSAGASASDHCEDVSDPRYDPSECEGATSGDYQKGLGAYEKKDYAAAIRALKPLAEQGNADAQYYLGRMFEYGEGVPQNDKTAVKLYTLAAKQGHTDAQYNLGWMYENGKGVPQDDKTAAKWYSLAAEQGIALAQKKVNKLQRKVAEHNKLRELQTRAKQGNADAQYNLGWMYYYGRGVPQDYKTAEHLLRKSTSYPD